MRANEHRKSIERTNKSLPSTRLGSKNFRISLPSTPKNGAALIEISKQPSEKSNNCKKACKMQKRP